MKVTTKTAGKQVWASPDGSKKIWQVTVFDENDKAFGLQTFSEAIAQAGFTGDVETYQKGENRFVKQIQTEGSGYKGGGGNNAARLKADADKQAEIKAEWAIAKAIASLQIFPLDDDALKQVEELAVKLNAMVDRVKVSNLAKETE